MDPNPTKHTAISKPSLFLAFRSSTAFITLAISYAVFTEQFLYAVIVPVAPFALHERAHIPEDHTQYWVAVLLAVYGVAALVSSRKLHKQSSSARGVGVQANEWTAPWGWWTDRRSHSRQLPFLLGLVSVLVATILLWVASNPALFVLGRILQGISSTVIWTTGLAILVDTVGEGRIGEYLGWVGVALNLGTLVAPMLGGIVFARAGYNAVFAMAIAVVGVDVVLRVVMVERGVTERKMRERKDFGDVESLASVEVIEEKEVKKLGAKATVVTVTMVDPSSSYDDLPGTEKLQPSKEKRKWRLPPVLTLLTSWRFLSALWGVAVQASIYSAFEAVLPLTLTTIFGWTSIGAGLVFVPLNAPGLLGPLVGMLSDRFGPRWLATAGFLGMCPALVLLRFVDQDVVADEALLYVLLVVIGFCSTLTLEPLMAEITYLGGSRGHTDGLDGGRVGSYAQAYALFNLAWSAGDTFGPLWAGLIVEKAGWQTMTWSLGLLSGLSAIPTVLWCGGWLFSPRSSR